MSRGLEKVFWVIAGMSLTAYVLVVTESRLYQLNLDREFTESRELPSPAPPRPVSAAAPSEGHVLGRLAIP